MWPDNNINLKFQLISIVDFKSIFDGSKSIPFDYSEVQRRNLFVLM